MSGNIKYLYIAILKPSPLYVNKLFRINSQAIIETVCILLNIKLINDRVKYFKI